MTEQLEILNTEAHKTLRMHEQPGDHPHFVMITIQEFPAAAAVCPIFFAKDSETGEFYAGALFGFREGELLVEGADRRDGLFRPLDLQRRGFFTTGENIAVDLSHPRFGNDAPIPLFDTDGQPSSALRYIQTILGQLHAGVDATRAFVRELLQLKLIEAIDVRLSFDDGETLQLDGLYTVTRDGLADLDDAQVINLFRKGYLQAAHCMTFSLNQIGVLARRRNERLARGL